MCRDHRLKMERSLAVKIRILIVDNDCSSLGDLKMLLINNGYDVSVVMTGKEGLEKINSLSFDVVLAVSISHDLSENPSRLTGFTPERQRRIIDSARRDDIASFKR